MPLNFLNGQHFGGTCCLHFHFCPEDGSRTSPLNVGNHLPGYTLPKRRWS